MWAKISQYWKDHHGAILGAAIVVAKSGALGKGVSALAAALAALCGVPVG